MEHSTHGEQCGAVGVQLKARVPRQRQQHPIVITGGFHVDHDIPLCEVRVHPSGMRASFVQPCTYQQRVSARREHAPEMFR